eukprot:TRINITY_DN82922_c0_g1_i1.p1 TRINITY_DN82922_c0_g1~~TRINITY_DN82922_c0_g1_i1.p1  ORF type:complete len:165 (-),score=11.98 TRINITY_DN82922_c0_g1_i1:264-758(-)
MQKRIHSFKLIECAKLMIKMVYLNVRKIKSNSRKEFLQAPLIKRKYLPYAEEEIEASKSATGIRLKGDVYMDWLLESSFEGHKKMKKLAMIALERKLKWSDDLHAYDDENDRLPAKDNMILPSDAICFRIPKQEVCIDLFFFVFASALFLKIFLGFFCCFAIVL